MTSQLFETDAQRFIRCYQHARGYHHRAQRFARQARTVSLVFNVAAIAVECYLIALCARHGIMPMNHNYRSLVFSAAEKVTFTEPMMQHILALDKIFGICSVDEYYHGAPGENDQQQILTLCQELDAFIAQDPMPADKVDGEIPQ